jgi:hypothetical protein
VRACGLSKLSALQGIKIHAHVADFYGILLYILLRAFDKKLEGIKSFGELFQKLE